MSCSTCCFWRHIEGVEPDDNGIPPYATCRARPPSPQIFAVKDVAEWNESVMAVAWPRTLRDDVCAGHIHRDLIDPATGTFKRPIVPDGETMQ